MDNVWQLQEAKNKFSRLVDQAHRDGPQYVTRHGKESVVILSIDDYQKLNKPQTDLFTFLKNSPLYNVPIDLERDKSMSRDISL